MGDPKQFLSAYLIVAIVADRDVRGHVLPARELPHQSIGDGARI
jgi:hypothetical protein